MRLDCFNKRESGWPMPPDAPQTVTLTIAYKKTVFYKEKRCNSSENLFFFFFFLY